MKTEVPRYSPHLPLPLYRYIPGKGPKDEHRKDLPKIKKRDFSEAYRYGIDLFNHEFYYEAHEVWEELWHEVGHSTLQGKFLKALIQLSAIQLKLILQETKPAHRLQTSAQKLLEDILLSMHVKNFMGISLPDLIQQSRQFEKFQIKFSL